MVANVDYKSKALPHEGALAFVNTADNSLHALQLGIHCHFA
jgi:hypothetical protein